MTTSNENFDPRSLPNLSTLLTHSAHKRNKLIANKTPLTSPGLKESFLHNVPAHSTLESDVELQIPKSSSQSTVVSDERALETKLPISPPPEEEIRIKELSTQVITTKDLNSRLPVRSRPGTFKVPGLPQSFADFQLQQALQPNSAWSTQEFDPTASGTTTTLTAAKPNPRKRTRAVLPSHGGPTSIPTDTIDSDQSFIIVPSPNPKARKQPKRYNAGVYTGSGFKRRHKRGTSAESLDSIDDRRIIPPVSTSLKSPVRKKRHDPGVMDYTPERERALTSINKGSPTKRKPSGRRSSTPDVRYEPPTEQFTPPRDVILQIPSSTVSSRSRNTKSSVSTVVKSSLDRKVVKVKVERLTSPFPLPPLDLSKPVPPPSPTDDPLLLVGPPEILRRSAIPVVVPNKTFVDASIGVDDDIFQDEPSSPAEDEGEFTGRFKFYSVPVKQDPPSSATRARRESWGRPISPFPFSKRSRKSPSPEGIQDSQVLLDEDSPPPSPSVGRRRSLFPTQEREPAPSALNRQVDRPRNRSFTLSEMEARLETRIAEVPPPQLDHDAVLPEMQDWEGSTSDHDDEDIVSVEREVTPIDGPDPSTSRDSSQTLAPSSFALGHLIEMSKDIADQQAYFETSHSGQPEYLIEDEGAENVNHENYPQVTSQVLQLPSRPLCSTFPVTPDPLIVSLQSFKASQSTNHFVALSDDSSGDTPGFESTHDGNHFYEANIPPSGLVEVSSNDPKAAARAAAILKLHHSYIVDGDIAQRHRSSSFIRRSSPFGNGNMESDHNEEFIHHARRKITAASAEVHRPQVMVPSPVIQSTLSPGNLALPTISPEDALRAAETEIRAATASPARLRTPIRSLPLAAESPGHCVVTPPSLGLNCHTQTDKLPIRSERVKEWTKAHWKTLDMCFTDERIAVGSAMGLNNKLAEVDDIEIESVVERFLAQVDNDDDWDQEMLLRRASALSRRQRAGKGAPPSPGVSRNTTPEFMVPIITPSVISHALSPVTEAEVPTKLPPSLLAPRYAHLHEEVTTVPSTPCKIPALASRSSTSEIDTPESQTRPAESSQMSTLQYSGPAVQPSGGVSVRPSAAKRVLSYVGSIIGRSGTIAPSKPPFRPSFNALPLPLPEMRPVTRGPINTPAKKPIPKTQPPRELVHLTETQISAKPSQFPPKVKSAKEMVHLNHVEPPRSVQRPRTVSGPIQIPGRTRKDSGSSVKDLIKSFEAVQKDTEEEMKRSNSRLAVRKVASVGSFSTKPLWKP